VSESTSSNVTPINSDSAPTVQERFQFGPSEEGEPTKIKCTTCKVPTTHLWFMQTVAAEFTDPVELADKHKRVTLCTNCGTLRLIK
jgi:hypothetical protein